MINNRFQYKVWMKTPLDVSNGDLLLPLAIHLSSLLLYYLDGGFDGWIKVDPKDEEWMKVKVKNGGNSV